MRNRIPDKKLTIIGGGIIGYFEAYFAYLDAKENGTQLRVTLHEKNPSLDATTVMHLVPNLTPAEIIGVIPYGNEFLEKLSTPFYESGGLQVSDVVGANDSAIARAFQNAVVRDGLDPTGHAARTKSLLQLGQKSMDLWLALFEHGDDELKKILIASNFHPCKERSRADARVLNDGYRIDLTFDYPNAANRAQSVLADYSEMGYQDCRILSPDEVCEIDPYLTDFCEQHSIVDASGKRIWQHDAIATWRPGGCIDTKIFLPLFCDYLEKVMGQYIDENGYLKNCFRVHYQRNVEDVRYENKRDELSINGLKFFGNPTIKSNKRKYQHSAYAFCPGENVGTLRKLGMDEPDYARIAGTSLMLRIPLPEDKLKDYANFSHYMSVFSDGVSSAWQARLVGKEIIIGTGGTKGFYGDQEPQLHQEFALNRAVKQLNMINALLPSLVSQILNKNTQSEILTAADLTQLEQSRYATRWVGSRAVAYDGYPTLGTVYHAGQAVANARCTTHLGSGGNSFSLASIFTSRHHLTPDNEIDKLTKQVLTYSDSRRGK